jgi:hypothetical protein
MRYPKLFLSVCLSFLLFGCVSNTGNSGDSLNRHEITVAVYYPTTIDTVKVIGDFYNNTEPKVSSDRGSNSIYVDGGHIGKTCIETSAPIKILDSKIIQYNVKSDY